MLFMIAMLVTGGCLLALRNWRWGVAAAIAIGLLQDPLRKLVPGVPPILAMTSAPVWVATLVSAHASGHLAIGRFLEAFPRLGFWVRIFAAYLVIPAAISFTYGPGTWQITLLGVFIYLGMFLMMVSGWRFTLNVRDAERILAFYGIAASLLLIGGPLEALGLQDRMPVLGTDVLGHLWVTYRTGAPVYMRAGFFRGPDVMGWHASLVFMISVMMAFRSKGIARWTWIGLGVWAILNIWLCGRRKMLSMVPVFLGMYLFLIFHSKTMGKILSGIAIVLLIIGLAGYFISSYYYDEAVQAFYLSALTEFEESIQRHGIDSVVTTVQQAGFWGYGLGMSQQGVHNIRAEKPRLWQESGPSKLFAELGIPGSLLFLLLGGVLALTAYHVVQVVRKDPSFYYSAGILSLLLANMASAVVSAQIFGDPLVALFLSFLLGLLLASARMHPTPETEWAEEPPVPEPAGRSLAAGRS